MAVKSFADWVPLLIVTEDGEFHVKPIPQSNRIEFRLKHKPRVFDILQKGSMVIHPKFGIGEIEGVSEAQPGLVSIHFEGELKRKDAIKVAILKFQNPENPQEFRGFDF